MGVLKKDLSNIYVTPHLGVKYPKYLNYKAHQNDWNFM